MILMFGLAIRFSDSWGSIVPCHAMPSLCGVPSLARLTVLQTQDLGAVRRDSWAEGRAAGPSCLQHDCASLAIPSPCGASSVRLAPEAPTPTEGRADTTWMRVRAMRTMAAASAAAAA